MKSRYVFTLVKMTTLSFLFVMAAASAQQEQWSLEKIKEKAASLTSDATAAVLGKDGGNRLFYFPLPLSEQLPSAKGYAFKDVYFNSGDGTRLHGWELPATTPQAKGVVVFSHGNAGTMHSHFVFCSWLLKAGYHVLMYDYRGYGQSKGTLQRKGMIEDVQAALKYARDKEQWAKLPLFSFGHSLGAAKSIVALSLMKDRSRIKGAIAWAGFASYVDIATSKIGATAKRVVTDEWSPKDHVENLSPTPLLIVHGKRDTVVAVTHANRIFRQARVPKKMVISQSGGHVNMFHVEKKRMRREVLDWCDQVKMGP